MRYLGLGAPSQSPAPKTTSDKIKTHTGLLKSRPIPIVWLAPCLSPPPAAPSPASRARMAQAATTPAKRSGNCYPALPKDKGTRAAGGGKGPPSPAKSFRERSSSKYPFGPWGAVPSESPPYTGEIFCLLLMSTSWRTFFTPLSFRTSLYPVPLLLI